MDIQLVRDRLGFMTSRKPSKMSTGRGSWGPKTISIMLTMDIEATGQAV